MANGLEVTLDKVFAITADGSRMPRLEAFAASDALYASQARMRAADAQIFIPKAITLTQSVNVIFMILP